MDPMRNNEESVKPPLSQPFSSVAAFNQANREQVAPINQIGRRPSISADLPVAPQSQRADSRIGIAPQAPLTATPQQIPIQRPVQQQQPNVQPQFQPRQILQQQPPQQFQDPRPVINRGPPPVQQAIPGQQPIPGHQQQGPPSAGPYQQVRGPVPQPQLQQRPLIRAPIPAQVQNLSSVQPNQANYPSVLNRPPQPAPQSQFNPNLTSDGQGIRFNQPIQPNQQYRPPVQPQPRPINPAFNPNVQKLPAHLEERSRMATEVNAPNPTQPNYLINTSDDVDDVIVRPIGNMKIEPQIKADYDLKQQQPRSIPEPQKNPSSVLQNSHPESNIAVAKRPSREDTTQKQNGTNGKSNDDSQARATSRASSHKSQEDINRSSSRSRLKLFEKPAEPVKKTPMNKIRVGKAPPPNLREIKSKIGSLQNTTHRPGGGNVKIEHKKLEYKVQSRIAAKNDTYMPGGGDKKIISTKLTWNAKSKIGSLDNKDHKPGGGDKKILNFKSDNGNSKPKVGSKESDIADKQSSESANE